MSEENPGQTKRTPGQAKKDHEYLTDMAHRAFGDDEEKCEKFVDTAMTRLGHKRITSYEDAEPEPEEGGEGEPAEPEDDLAGSFEETDEGAEPPKRGRSYWKK